MPSKLRNKKARVSFFAFQDMITTVTGVLILVMLLLSLRVTQSAFSNSATTRNQLREQVEQARRELAEKTEALGQRQSELSALSNRVFVIPDLDSSGKQPVLVVVSATNGWCSRLGQTNRTQFRINKGGLEFKALLNTWDARRDRLVFYVRPSGIAHFLDCLELAKQGGFDRGYDVAEEEGQYVLLNQ
jgi:hypothetical protein